MVDGFLCLVVATVEGPNSCGGRCHSIFLLGCELWLVKTLGGGREMPKTKATFIEPMLLLRVEKLPQGADWSYEIKLDGYRALAIKSGGKVQVRSRNDNDFTERYSSIAAALRSMPDETVLDGEMAALNEEGRPSFNLLQNYGSSKAPLVYFVFDLLMLKGRM